jgi:PAS domain S-box-containing protein
MTQSAIDSMPYSLPPLKLKRTWSVGSVVASIAAVLVSILVFALSQTEASQMVSVVAIGMLLVIVLLHTRFLAYAQGESRETNALLLTKERESISIFEHTQDAILVLDDDGICQSANPSAGTFFSMPPARMVGQSMRAFFADEDAFVSMWSGLGGERSNQGEVELVRATGATVFAECTTAAHFLPRRHLVILRDTTTRRRAQEAVQQSLMVARSSWQQAETMRLASLALTEDRRMNSVLDSLLTTLAQFVPYGRAQLFLLETDRLFIAREAESSSQTNMAPDFPETLALSEYPLFMKVLEAQEGLLIEHLASERISRRLGNDSPAACFIGVPIASSRETLGLLSLTAPPASSPRATLPSPVPSQPWPR